MKVFIAFLICIVAVSGEEREVSKVKKSINELLEQSAEPCRQELKLMYPHITDEINLDTSPFGLEYDACYHACLDQKVGAMNKDGTYNLERIRNFMETAEDRQRAENIYSTRIKECASIVGKNPCKMSACIHRMPKSYYMNKE